MPVGRPSKYKQSTAKGICLRIMTGESLRSICSRGKYPSKVTVLTWLQKHPEFLAQYTQAREIQQETHYDELFELSDISVSEEDSNVRVQRDKLRIDTRKWAMERMAAKKYSPQSKVDHTSSDGSMTPTTITRRVVDGTSDRDA